MSEPPRKRRAVRKGTRNCWECKRRKVRCIFAAPGSAACENCVQRRTSCVSQEYEQESILDVERPVEGLEDRLIRVEHLLQQVLDREKTRALSDHTHEDHALAFTHNDNYNPHSLHLSAFPAASTTPISTTGASATTSNYSNITQRLLALWPNEYDLGYIHNLPANLSTHLSMQSSTSPAGDTPRGFTTVRAMLRLPPPGSHPTLIARRLLILGSLLQGALSLPDLQVHRRERFEQLMLTILDTVAKSITTNEGLTSSVEGLECILLEALILNHTGKLHQAWRVLGQVTAVGQTLGLNGNAPLLPEYFLDPKTRSDFDAEYFCFQVAYLDRCLSMILGLPCASQLPCATTPERLTSVRPTDRMARLHLRIAQRLSERTKRDISEDRDIDTLLLEAADQMPHQWWLVPERSRLPGVERSHSDIITQFTFQLAHYHLLLRLYLPYVLQPLDEAEHARGKRIAWNTSREILSRFLNFRKWNNSRYYCRSMDFLALIALTVLCVAHIESRRLGARATASASTSSELAHSYATDRGMMQQILEVMQWMEYDELASNLAKMMQSLLDIEADAANGTEYRATAVHNSETSTEYQSTEYQSELLDEGRKLQLRIPYFGTITLQRMPGSALIDVTTAANGIRPTAQNTFEATLDSDVDWSEQVAACDDWTLQNVNQALFLDLFGST